MSKTFTRDEVSKHNTDTNFYIIIDSKVYDITKFLKFHPGGRHVLLAYAGKDATDAFYSMHRVDVLTKYAHFVVGTIEGEKAVQQGTPRNELSQVPYAEPSAFMGFKSAYFTESHLKFKKACRTFFDTEIRPKAEMMENSEKEAPLSMWQAMGKAGILASRIGPGPWLKPLCEGTGLVLPGGVKPEEFDYFHELIAHQEMMQLGTPGLCDGLGAGFVIGLPCLVNFGNEEQRTKIAPQIFLGNKRISLAISEAFAGSDVANIQTTATLSPCKQFYIVNGTKKWITNATFSDYFVTAVRTGGKGHKGLSMLLIERSEGVGTQSIKTSYSAAAGTGYITFDNVKVPVKNLLGKEGNGFAQIMYNFNHERWLIICGVVRQNRLVIEECLKWATQRMVFGKPLMEQPVIRFKIAQMISANEACENWLENITYQMCKMSYNEQAKHLAGPIALLKYQSTRVAYLVGDNAAQVFGGRAITRSGMGQVVERHMRAIKYGAILGGSEEIMADLGVRQAMKYLPKNAKL